LAARASPQPGKRPSSTEVADAFAANVRPIIKEIKRAASAASVELPAP
jgi:hypothetical protein